MVKGIKPNSNYPAHCSEDRVISGANGVFGDGSGNQNYQNNLQEDAFQSTHSPNITADMTDSATIDGTVDETIIDQPYSPLNAISPNTLKTFVKVIDLARNEYVKPINDEELFENAMKGMLKNIDPYAEFLDAQSYENLQAFTQGEIAQVGIVAEYSKQDDHWKITDIVQDSPANQSGIGKGFFLHQIDGFKLNKKTNQHDVNQLLSGMAGTMVDIVVSDAGRRKHKVTLQRTQPKKTAVTLIFDRNIAIIKIPVFQDNTRQQILDALVSLGKPIHGIVLDLQDNPGGLINSAIEVAGLFQKNIPVVQIENREGQRELMNAEGSSHLEDVPVVILQNRYSTSAAEVLASSIQSSKRGYVIGETSYGKGTVQAVIPIDNKQAVKLTVAYYLTADGKQINGVGVKPDIALMSDSIGQIDPDETSIDGLMNNSLTHKTTGKGINNNIKEGMNQDVYQTSNDISQKSIQNANIIPATQKSTNQRSKTPNNANIKDSISSQDIHKRWQQQAVDILLERNHYTNRALREKRLTQLARLNQQNRQLRKSLQSQNRNNITKNNKNNGQDNISNLGQIQYELEKNIAIPNGFLLVYPKTEP